MICPRCAEPLSNNATECRACKLVIPSALRKLASLPTIEMPSPPVASPVPQFITCPFCKEEVRVHAMKCKHCQSMLVEQKSDTVAMLLALVLGPVGLWYKGQWAAGFAWIAGVFIVVFAFGVFSLFVAPMMWLFMAAHAYGAAERV